MTFGSVCFFKIYNPWKYFGYLAMHIIFLIQLISLFAFRLKSVEKYDLQRYIDINEINVRTAFSVTFYEHQRSK